MLTISIALVGLPGSGKTRLQQAILQPSTLNEGSSLSKLICCYEHQDIQAIVKSSTEITFTLCIIDVRSIFQENRDEWLETELNTLLGIADAVVFNFLEASGLDEQSWWGRWVKARAEKLPIIRVLNGVLPSTCLEEIASRQNIPRESMALVSPLTLQRFEFEVGRICLDHLLLGLDSSKQNLAMKIVRVTGVVETIEYDNLIQIEGSALRWDMYAAEERACSGVIVIEGLGLDRAWLAELIKASLT